MMTRAEFIAAYVMMSIDGGHNFDEFDLNFSWRGYEADPNKPWTVDVWDESSKSWKKVSHTWNEVLTPYLDMINGGHNLQWLREQKAK